MSQSIEERLLEIDKLLREVSLAGARKWLGVPEPKPRNEGARRAR